MNIFESRVDGVLKENIKNHRDLSKAISFLENSVIDQKLIDSLYKKSGKVKGVRFNTLSKICEALDCQPGDILEYR